MPIIGYARVSTAEQSVDLQLDALNKHGRDETYVDQGWSGSRFQRPGLEEALKELRKGDVFVVWRLDRLGRSIANLIQFVEELEQKRVQFQSITERIDTTSSGGKLFFHMIAALAEFERQIIRERTIAGLEAARSRGRRLGRPRKVNETILEEVRLLLSTGRSLTDVAADVGLSRRTLKRYLDIGQA